MQNGIRSIQKLLSNVDKLAEEQQHLREHWQQQELDQELILIERRLAAINTAINNIRANNV